MSINRKANIGLARNTGFTLLEMMIVVAIIGVLAMIAVPSYQRHIDRTHRLDAQTALISLASAMERRYTEQGSYCDLAVDTSEANTKVCGVAELSDLGRPRIFAQSVPADGGAAIYDLLITAASRTTYTIEARPVAGRRMANDECGAFTLTQNRTRGIITDDKQVTVDGCWYR